MRIKRFNESDEHKGLRSSKWKEIDGDIWISKTDIINILRSLRDETKKELSKHDSKKIIENVTIGDFSNALFTILNELRSAFEDIGGNPRGELDPYGEEVWEDE